MCGADNVHCHQNTSPAGSSPRVRSRLGVLKLSADYKGIISACAEQTHDGSTDALSKRDHLRVCGADALPELEDLLERGSSPRVRSRP